MTMGFSGRGRPLDTLKHEEKIALWSLRKLLGPQHQRGEMSLTGLLGKEAYSLHQRFHAFFLHTVHTTCSLHVSSTEQHLLQVMAEMQILSHEDGIASELRKALLQLSMTLAAYGYWLPQPVRQVSSVQGVPHMGIAQDNYPPMMQAAE
ncbi:MULTISPECIES: hypothetical protein [unclassified Saccharibacter]|uniref:hypothetical protein n=1 Tax=unclassified Saccharibacter TaxID=2648722 RepID=UPI00132986DE|nr:MULTISPECIES: hypothetical protein [unclassified Saccharibacter]MXV35702.1 hypothetical protein [Saccharibacter sp. EH611]MXV58316.1 hypothetical protein [Saccharibacter sp. EH70]MXV65792.1 hypothetical protein [Saccharibacter sp. EH60]